MASYKTQKRFKNLIWFLKWSADIGFKLLPINLMDSSEHGFTQNDDWYRRRRDVLNVFVVDEPEYEWFEWLFMMSLVYIKRAPGLYYENVFVRIGSHLKIYDWVDDGFWTISIFILTFQDCLLSTLGCKKAQRNQLEAQCLNVNQIYAVLSEYTLLIK